MRFLTQAATSAEKVDSVFLFILALCVAFLVFITFLMIYFVIRYSRRRNPKPKDIEGNTALEVTWTLVPLALFLGMFYFGWTNFAYLRRAPRDAMVVRVIAKQWDWLFEYANGKKTEDLYIAVDKPVRLELRSLDVIHGFYVPAFRIKMDAIPGKENYTWFQPTLIGSFDIQCTVICGAEHSYMLAKAVVVSQEEFLRWYFGGEDAPLPSPDKLETAAATQTMPPGHPGYAVLKDKQCLTCHSTDGKEMVGPTFKGLFGSRQLVREGDREREIIIDEAYVRTAIHSPMAAIVKGYPAAMPPVDLSDEQVTDVIDFIRSLD